MEPHPKGSGRAAEEGSGRFQVHLEERKRSVCQNHSVRVQRMARSRRSVAEGVS